MNELKKLTDSEGFQAEVKFSWKVREKSRTSEDHYKKVIFSPLIKGDTLDRSRKRRSVLEKDTSKKVAAVKRKDPRAEYAGWYAMYANEKNAAKGKLSYTRYNFYKKINFKEKIKVMEEGSEENGDNNETVMFSAYLDKDLTIPLTEKNSRVGEEIQVTFS